MSAAILPLHLDGIGFAAGGVSILRAIDATIAPGVRTAIVGPNGAGKSTLLRVMHGLIAPTQGALRWANGESRPRAQAMVFQRPILLRRSALANVEYALALAGVAGSERRRRALAALGRVGLLGIASRAARVLSSGEQQRVALARAWALEPTVLFLDEPTASLDPTAARNVEEIVQAIHAAGTTIVMTTHNLALARRFADEVLFLDGGRIGEAAPAARFFNHPGTPRARAFIDGELS